MLHRIEHFGAKVGNTAAAPSYISITGLAKRAKLGGYIGANEYICSELGRLIGLPVPHCAFARDGNKKSEVYFCSLSFNVMQVELSNIIPPMFVNNHPSISAGIIVFDILIGNPDRHKGNLGEFLHRDGIDLFVFDHSHALLGIKAGEGSRRLDALSDRLGIASGGQTLGNAHCLGKVVSNLSFFNEWLSRVESIPDWYFKRLIDVPLEHNLITKTEAEHLFTFFIERKSKIRGLILDNLNQFPRLQSRPIL